MKPLSIVLAAATLIMALLLLRQHAVTGELKANVNGLIRDRDEVRAELKKLSSRLGERPGTSTTNASGSIPAESAPSLPAKVQSPKPAEPVATPGVTITAPKGWRKNGRNPENYVVGVDTLQTWGGMPSAYVQSLGESKEGFGGMMQSTAAENYAGQRVRLNAWIKTEDANDGGGHLWLRIDGQERGQMLGFDNMDNRAVKGTADWQEASVVLDVPPGAASLNYGFFVSGGGKMWVNGQTITVVGPEVATTNMLKPESAKPKAPTNLGFYPDPPK